MEEPRNPAALLGLEVYVTRTPIQMICSGSAWILNFYSETRIPYFLSPYSELPKTFIINLISICRNPGPIALDSQT